MASAGQNRVREQWDFEAAGFALLRTPLLPWDAFAAWSSGLALPKAESNAEVAAAITSDRLLLRQRLASTLEEPVVREALFVASPSLVESLSAWHDDPDSKRGRNVERSVVKYFSRMSTRPTPFGSFSGCSTVYFGATTDLRLAPRTSYRRHTRLDNDYMFRLCAELQGNRQLRTELIYVPNSSLARFGGSWHYARARVATDSREYSLVVAKSDVFLDAALERARSGARISEIVDALLGANDGDDIDCGEAEAFVHELIDRQLLEPPLSPNITGPEPVQDIVSQLSSTRAGKESAAALAKAQASLDALDRRGLGNSLDAYREVATTLGGLPTQPTLSRLFQVDLFKPTASATLDSELLELLQRGVEVLHAIYKSSPSEALERFKADFSRRYQSRAVPLLEALDEELGVGFGVVNTPSQDHAPILDGLNWVVRDQPSSSLTSKDIVLMDKLLEARQEGLEEIELTDNDVERMRDHKTVPLPDAFCVSALLVPSQGARHVERIVLRSGFGPSGARTLGRFGHGDERLAALIRDHLAAEERHDPAAIHAEIVHLPEGRTGNVLLRPVYREFELEFLGRSGAPRERRIQARDLWVTLKGGNVVLFSERLQKRIVPRLTSAHGPWRGIGVYRFLCALQTQGTASPLSWSWGPLGTLRFLPRVTYGRVILCEASWNVPRDELAEITQTGSSEQVFNRVSRWRASRGLPRHIQLVDEDNRLTVDLDNILSIECFLQLVRGRDRAILAEMLPGPDQLAVAGPEGRFTHEIMVPLQRRAVVKEHARSTISLRTRSRHEFPPGTEWLYYLIYTGRATADHLLTDVVAPIVSSLQSAGLIDTWFFLRYGAPDWHLRLRVRGRADSLLATVAPALSGVLEPSLKQGLVHRVEIGTYAPELERYGGPAGVRIAEELFRSDSEAVIEILQKLAGDENLWGDEGTKLRSLLAYVGVDRLLDDFGVDLRMKLELTGAWRRAAVARQSVANRDRSLGRKFRAERAELRGILEPGKDHPREEMLAVLADRSARNRTLVDSLHNLQDSGRLWLPTEALIESYVHMHLNRLLKASHRAQEMVIYELLHRFYRGQRARAGQD